MLHIDMLEIDVHYTKIKNLSLYMMILSIVRQMVKGKVSDFTLKELKALDFGFYKGEKFKGRVYRLLMKC